MTHSYRDALPVTAACAAAAMFVACAAASGILWVNDDWFLLAIGRHAAESGPSRDASWFSVMEGASTVEQQWLYALVLWRAYEAAGPSGVVCLSALAQIALAALTAALGARLRGEMPGWAASLAFAALFAALVLFPTMRSRPSVASSVIWVVDAHLALSAARHPRRRARCALAAAFALLCALHASLHASMLPFDFAVYAAFFIEGRLVRQGAPARPRSCAAELAAALAAGAALSVLNPYGPIALLYTALSAGAAAEGGYVAEMAPFADSAVSWQGWAALAAAASPIAAWALRLRSGGARGLAPAALAALSLAMTLGAVRCASVLLLFSSVLSLAAFPMLAPRPMRHLPQEAGAAHRAASWMHRAGWCAAAAMLVASCGCLRAASQAGYGASPYSPGSVIEVPAAVAFISGDWEGEGRPTVLADGNAAGILQFSGCRTQIDARPELYAPAITGLAADYNRMWLDYQLALAAGDAERARGYVSGLSCDYALASSSTGPVGTQREAFSAAGYERVASGSGELSGEEYYYELWKRVQ